MTPTTQDLMVPAPLILVVDDDPAVCGSLKFSLELEGYRVRTFASAREVLEDPNLASADCLIIDQVLPEVSGLGLLRELRSRGISLPALLITSNPAPLLRDRAAAAGVPIVEKPLLGNALLDAIAGVLATRAGAAAGTA
jgi:FixJ family two-component response regulator